MVVIPGATAAVVTGASKLRLVSVLNIILGAGAGVGAGSGGLGANDCVTLTFLVVAALFLATSWLKFCALAALWASAAPTPGAGVGLAFRVLLCNISPSASPNSTSLSVIVLELRKSYGKCKGTLLSLRTRKTKRARK